MTQASATLTQTDVARLLGRLAHPEVRYMILALGREVTGGRAQWAPHRGQPDTFGPSLALQASGGSSLSKPQVNSARTGLLQRNWQQLKDLLVRDVVVVRDALINSIKGAAPRAPQRPARRSRRSSTNRSVTPPAAPQAPAETRQCGQRAWGVTCTEPRGHAGACIGDNQGRDQRPTNDVDRVLAAADSITGVTATVSVTRTVPVAGGEDAQFARFRLVIEAAWDDVPVVALAEPEDDPSAARFRMLDLD